MKRKRTLAGSGQDGDSGPDGAAPDAEEPDIEEAATSPGAVDAFGITPALVDAAVAGDEAAFSELVRLTHTEMYGLAYRLVGNEDDARDVLQEAYLRAYRSLPKFRGDAAFTTWLYRITANAAYTFMRRRGRHRAESLDGIDELEATGPRPDEVSQNLSLRGQLTRRLLELPPEQRAVVVMKDVYDLPHDVIAKELGISVTAAKVRLHRARKRLRSALESEGVTDAEG